MATKDWKLKSKEKNSIWYINSKTNRSLIIVKFLPSYKKGWQVRYAGQSIKETKTKAQALKYARQYRINN